MANWWTGWRSRLALLASALLVPLLVAGAFVWAGWQSSDRLHHNQGVVVNLDQAVTKNGKTSMLGNQFGAQLVSLSGSQYDWDFGVSSSQAQSGLASGRYSVAVVIPKDFTQALLSNGKQRTVLTIQSSPLANVDQKMLAGTLAGAAQRGLARQLGSTALSSIYVTFDQVDKDLVVASGKATDAANSATSLSTLAGTATTQATTVKKDTATVASGAATVASDAQSANQSARTASKSGNAGASAAATAGAGASTNAAAASSAATAAAGVGSAVGAANSGATSASSAAGQVSAAASGLGANSSSISTAASSAANSATAYQKAITAALAQQKSLSGQLTSMSSSVGTYNKDVSNFTGAVQSWSTTVVSTGSGGTVDTATIDAAMTKVVTDANKLVSDGASVSKVQSAIQTFLNDLNTLSSKTPPSASDPSAGASTTVVTGGDLSALPTDCTDAAKTSLYKAVANADSSSDAGDVCADYRYLITALINTYNITNIHGVDANTLADDIKEIYTGNLPTTGDTMSMGEKFFLPIYGCLISNAASTTKTTVTVGGGGYSAGYTAGYKQAQADLKAVVAKDATSTSATSLSTLTATLGSVSTDIANFDPTTSTSDLAKLKIAVDALSGSTSGGAGSTTVTGAQVLADPTVSAASTALDTSQKAVTSAVALAVSTDKANTAANAKAASVATNSTDLAALKSQLASVLAANASEAQRIKTLTGSLTALQTGMTNLTTALTLAQQKAALVVKQTAATSTGASALAAQITAVQKQLATASGAGAGTAAQTAKVASGATKLSSSASSAAQEASGLSSTVGQVSTQSKTVSTKAGAAASAVKDTSQTVSNQNSQTTTTTTGSSSGSASLTTVDQARHPNISWWSPLATMAMWLGAMTMYMLFRPISKATRISTAAPAALVAEVLAPGTLIGAIQAGVMTIVSTQVMHLGAADAGKTFGVMLLMAAAFMAANFVLAAVLGVLGRIISIVFALITGLGVVTNALPEVFDTVRNLSPLTPALDAVRGIAAGAPGTLDSVGQLALWAAGGIALAGLLILRARVAEAPRVPTVTA